MDTGQLRTTHFAARRWQVLAVLALSIAVTSLWLWFTPEGVLGKADAIGYAVCHRIASRSFSINGRPLPLCARCSGMYLGALLAMGTLVAAGRGRTASMPPRRVSLILLGLVAAMGVDGINSYMTFFPSLPHLYEPQNWLRLVTGVGCGLAIGTFVLPAFSGTVWRAPSEGPSLAGGRELLALIGLAVICIALILTENTGVLYVLAIVSSLAVLLLLGMIQVTLWLSALRLMNRVESWRGAVVPFVAGAALAIVQVGAIDALRYFFTRSWAGFSL